VSLVSLSWLCSVRHLWTDGCPDPINPCSPQWASC